MYLAFVCIASLSPLRLVTSLRHHPINIKNHRRIEWVTRAYLCVRYKLGFYRYAHYNSTDAQMYCSKICMLKKYV